MDVKPRTCLKCGKLFDSQGPANRICPRCQKINTKVRESELQKQRGEKRRNGNPLE